MKLFKPEAEAADVEALSVDTDWQWEDRPAAPAAPIDPAAIFEALPPGEREELIRQARQRWSALRSLNPAGAFVRACCERIIRDQLGGPVP